MADLNLNINGHDNASPALRGVGDAVGDAGEQAAQSAAKWNLIVQAIQKAGEVVVEFGKQSVAAFLEQEKADRQLSAVAGNLTDTFKAQATALQESLGVSDDMVESMQTMLLRYNVAPSEIDKTTRAILDYSAATGTDAVSATRMLESSATSGRSAFKELGITLNDTGSKSENLKILVEKLNQVVGGTAARDANSAEGSARIAQQAFDELKESFGKLIVDFAAKTSVIQDVTLALRGLKIALFGDDDEPKRNKIEAALKHENELIDEVVAARKELAAANAKGDTSDAAFWTLAIDAATKQIAEQKRLIATLTGGAPLPTSGVMSTPDATKHGKSAASKLDQDPTKDAAEARAKEEFRNDRELEAHDEEARQKHVDEVLRIMQDGQKKTLEEQDKARELRKKDLEDRQKFEAAILKSQEAFDEKQRMIHEKEQKQWQEAGDKIGAAFANALADSIGQLAKGGKVDVGEMVGTILDTALTIIGGIVGAYYGNPQAGAAIGHLAGTGAKALIKYGEHANEPRALSGESTRPGGNSNVTVNVSAIDGESTQRFFEKSGGRALMTAVRTNRGPAAQLFGSR